jgi:hypothetical protein
MAVELNHTIVPALDPQASAQFLESVHRQIEDAWGPGGILVANAGGSFTPPAPPPRSSPPTKPPGSPA